jgi:Mn2+/Fe2+ NRAMP family transporter
MFETVVMILVVTVAACFLFLLSVSKPNWNDVAWGFVPTGQIFTENGMLYMAMAIIGATVCTLHRNSTCDCWAFDLLRLPDHAA